MTTPPSKFRVDEIDIVDRQRKDLGDIGELAESIKELGMIQPIVIEAIANPQAGLEGQSDYLPRLVAGRRRLSALLQLGEEYLHHGTTCTPGMPGFVFFNEQNEEKRALVEYEEDIRRKARTWQEEVMAIAKIHKIRWIINAENGIEWGQKETGRLLGVSAAKMSYTMALAEEMKKDPEGAVAKSEGYTDAIKLLLQKTENEITAEQMKRRQAAPLAAPSTTEEPGGLPLFEQEEVEPTTVQLSSMVHNGMFIETAAKLPSGVADCAFVWGEVVTLDYEEIWRQLKPDGYMIVSAPLHPAKKFKERGVVYWNILGLQPQETIPFLPNANSVYIFEKGNPKPFNPSPTCVFSSLEVGLHSFIEFLLRPTSKIGDTILMPCGGPCEAIAKIGRYPLSFEPDKARFDSEVKALKDHYEATLPKVRFL